MSHTFDPSKSLTWIDPSKFDVGRIVLPPTHTISEPPSPETVTIPWHAEEVIKWAKPGLVPNTGHPVADGETMRKLLEEYLGKKEETKPEVVLTREQKIEALRLKIHTATEQIAKIRGDIQGYRNEMAELQPPVFPTTTAPEPARQPKDVPAGAEDAW